MVPRVPVPRCEYFSVQSESHKSWTPLTWDLIMKIKFALAFSYDYWEGVSSDCTNMMSIQPGGSALHKNIVQAFLILPLNDEI